MSVLWPNYKSIERYIKTKAGAGEKAQWMKALVAKPDDLGSVSGIYMVGGETRLPTSHMSLGKCVCVGGGAACPQNLRSSQTARIIKSAKKARRSGPFLQCQQHSGSWGRGITAWGHPATSWELQQKPGGGGAGDREVGVSYRHFTEEDTGKGNTPDVQRPRA